MMIRQFSHLIFSRLARINFVIRGRPNSDAVMNFEDLTLHQSISDASDYYRHRVTVRTIPRLRPFLARLKSGGNLCFDWLIPKIIYVARPG